MTTRSGVMGLLCHVVSNAKNAVISEHMLIYFCHNFRKKPYQSMKLSQIVDFIIYFKVLIIFLKYMTSFVINDVIMASKVFLKKKMTSACFYAIMDVIEHQNYSEKKVN